MLASERAALPLRPRPCTCRRRWSQTATIRELDHGTDALSRIDWRGFDPLNIAVGIPENARSAHTQLWRIGPTEEGGNSFFRETVAGSGEVAAFDPGYAVRIMLDIVPDPFRPAFERDFNRDEKDIAVYLGGEAGVT